ncbi:MAG: ABC transporter permease [Actinomycetia bacterium]|nr:ABC transporter permease [Actinomycetes bacterium]
MSVVAAPASTPRAAREHRLVFLRGGKSITGFVLLALFLITAVIGPMISPYDPSKIDVANPLAHPSRTHLLGTTALGQDVWSQLLTGTRAVVIIGFSAGLIATVLAVVIGVTAGYLGGAVDEILSMLSNIFLVLPGIPLIIIITSQLQSKSRLAVILVIALTGWAWGARVMRSQTLSLRNRDFVEAARANGESKPRIIFFEIIPNMTAIIASSFINTVLAAVAALVMLSFLGVISGNDWNWGTILMQAQNNMALPQGAWWWYVPAGLAVALLGMSLALINFGIDEFVNPRLRNTGMNAGVLRRRGVRPRVGFTPVVYEVSGKDHAARAEVGS